MKRTIVALIVAIAALGAFSCAKPPVAEMQAANAAVARVEADADARTYVPEAVAQVRDIVGRMEAESAAKRYDAAKSLAIEATEAADKAIRNGADAKAKAKTEAGSAVSAAKAALSELEAAFQAAKRVKRAVLDVAAADRDIAAAAKGVAGAESDLAKSDFKAAISKAQAARSAIADVQRRVSDAVQAASRKK